MDLTTLSDLELNELHEGAADLLYSTSVERVRRMCDCPRCMTDSRMALSMALATREVVHD